MAETSDDAARRVGIVVTRAGQETESTAQTDGLPRLVAIDQETAGSTALYMGKTIGEPGMLSQAHHHGEAETAAYVISGHARVFYGEGYDDYIDLHPGDFIYVPPMVPHMEMNPFDEPLETITARTPRNVVVHLAEARELDDADRHAGPSVSGQG